MTASRNSPVIGLIPARGGSKGIPGKNTIDLGGKPLIAHTIECALQSGRLDRVICSTDSREIADIALRFGAEAPFLRPQELGRDDTPALAVVRHAIDFLKSSGEEPKTIVLLQPTSPFRRPQTIALALDSLTDECDSVVAVRKTDENPYWMYVQKGAYISPFLPREGLDVSRRQNLPDFLLISGALYAVKTRTVMEQGKLIGKNTVPLILDPVESLDIDTPEDLECARRLLSEGKVHGRCR